MENEHQIRLDVLTLVYQKTSPKSISNTVSRNDIFQQTGIKWEKLIGILNYLCSKQLIELAYDDGLKPHYIITAQGIDEIEISKQQSNQPNSQATPQFFNNTFFSPVGAVQQGGQGNISTVNQNFSPDELILDEHALDRLQELVHTLTTNTANNLSPIQAYQAAAILMELKEAALNQDKNGQIQAVSKWRQWLNSIGQNAQKALSLVADLVSLGLPLAKILGLPVP